MSSPSTSRARLLSSVAAIPHPSNDEHPAPLLVKPKVAWKLLGCGNTRGYQLLAAGELESFRDGGSRKITVDSIRRYIARRLDATPAAPSEPQLGRRCGLSDKSSIAAEAGRGPV